jgi:hypothetical protein
MREEMRKVFTVIVYMLFLIFVYSVDGASFYFWLMAGIGIFVVAGSLIGVAVPGKKAKPETMVRHGKVGRQSETVYTYLSEYFLNRGNWYYYLTDDPAIRPNDVVVVPWGKNNNAELAIVGWVEQRTAADVPYPLSRMKYILRKASVEWLCTPLCGSCCVQIGVLPGGGYNEPVMLCLLLFFQQPLPDRNNIYSDPMIFYFCFFAVCD